MGLWKDLLRHKARTFLTIAGIAIGVFALVVLGAASENNNVYSARLTAYYENMISIADKNDMSFFGLPNGNRPLSMSAVREVAVHPGVTAAFPQISVLMDEKYMSIIPPVIISVAPGQEHYSDPYLAEGRIPGSGERGVVVLGSDIARQTKAKVGETVELRGKTFEVVGVMKRTFINLSDSAAYVGLEDARQLYVETLPKAFQSKVDPDDLAMGITAYTRQGVDADAVAAELERDIPGLGATGPQEMMTKVNGLISMLNAVVASIAVLALLIGGLSVINTMMMSVGERGREIGLKRALGASRRRVGREVLAEAALLGGIGGLIGIALGVLVALGLNSALLAATGTSAFLVTWRLAVGALLFSVVLGVLGGLYPARKAARVDPAVALAYE